MQANAVQISDHDRKQWMSDGTLRERLVEMSELNVSQFHASNSTQYWSRYEGKYDADISQIETYTFTEGETSADISATIYIDAQDKEWNYIVIGVRIMADETTFKDKINSNSPGLPKRASEAAENNEERAMKDTEKSGEFKPTGLKGKETGSGKMYPVWFAIAGIASAGFGCSLYSDFKVLRRYRQKKKEWEEGH